MQELHTSCVHVLMQLTQCHLLSVNLSSQRYETESPLEITRQQGSSAKVALCFAAAWEATMFPPGLACVSQRQGRRRATV